MTSAGAATGYNIYRTTDIVQSNQRVQNEQPRPEDSKCIGVPYPVKPPDKHELIPKQQSEGPLKITERPVEITDGKTKDCDRDRTFGVFLDGQQMPDGAGWPPEASLGCDQNGLSTSVQEEGLRKRRRKKRRFVCVDVSYGNSDILLTTWL
jgi:hypothetical protein